MITLLLATVLAGQVDGPGVFRLVQAHKGHTVVVSLWATWCDPCVKEFPWMMELARARRDVVFLSVSIDDPETRGALEAFVGTRQPPFPVYARLPGKDEAFINGVDPAWRGVVPATLVYGKDGQRTAILEGEHSRADLEKALGGAKP
ncbi:MAG TPA: TlpA disulfide reductase family protein [Vicinamibacteria bacterium]|nr:TlpA disulfide reductase family protein [Vicinamibacteria bacterium]